MKDVGCAKKKLPNTMGTLYFSGRTFLFFRDFLKLFILRKVKKKVKYVMKISLDVDQSEQKI